MMRMKNFICTLGTAFLVFILLGTALPVFADDAAENADDSQKTDDSGKDSSKIMDEESNDDMASADIGVVAENQAATDHAFKIAVFPEDKTFHAQLKTSVGTVSCTLFAGTHPLTVLNFMALAKGSPGWTDKTGTLHSEPYYRDLKFVGKKRNAYVMSGLREEGTDFVIADERCTSHGPVAGAIAMVQPHPGMASTQFILLARNMPVLKGMYAVFGQCGPIEVIKELTKSDAVLESIVVDDE